MFAGWVQRIPVSLRWLGRWGLTGVLLATIFLLDTRTHYEVAAAVFYAPVILAASRWLGRRGLLRLAGLCMGLTLLSFVLTPVGAREAGLINTGISLLAVVMTSSLLIKIDHARHAVLQAQAQLTRLARINSLEGLTTSLAHELNQPLAAIAASAQAGRRWLDRAAPDLPRAAQALQRVQDDAARAGQLIERVRALTRGAASCRSWVDCNALIQQLLPLVRAGIERQQLRLTLDLAAGLPPVWADPVQVQQVLGNLLLNAVEAMEAEIRGPRCVTLGSQVGVAEVRLWVADTGPGLAASMQDRLFEPFCTSKPQGIGLGLSISRSIVEAHGGRIGYAPNPGGGSVFSFSLPRRGGEPGDDAHG